MSKKNKYKVFYQGDVVFEINENKIKERNISDESLHDIKEIHLLNHLIHLKINKTNDIKTLISLAHIHLLQAKKLSILWKFDDKNFLNHYRFWELPKCKCPKMENMKLIGRESRILSDDCEMHRGF